MSGICPAIGLVRELPDIGQSLGYAPALDCSHQATEVLRFGEHRNAGHSCGAGIKRLPKVGGLNASESHHWNRQTRRDLV